MKRLFGLLLAGGLICGASAQDVDYSMGVIKKLASYEFAGRGYVADGNLKAARYIREQYRTIGLKPLGEDYFQKFDITVNTFPSTLKLSIDGVTLRPGTDYIVDPATPTVKGTYGVAVIGRDELLSEKMPELAGKMLIIDLSAPASEDREVEDKIKAQVKYLKESSEVPSVGTIVYTPGVKTTWHISRTQKKPGFTISRRFALNRIKEVCFDVKAKLTTCTTQNVVGFLPGTSQPDSFLVVTAHFDHLGMMGKEACFNGASDNATGTAFIIDLARYYAKHPHRYSIAFLAMSAEEVGLVGSRYCAEHPLFPLEKIGFLINFDMVGTGEEGIQVVNGTTYQQQFDRMRALNAEHHYLPEIRLRGESCNSDHCPFYQRGVPSFFIYTIGGYSGYHDVGDLPETLSMKAWENHFKLIVDFFSKWNKQN